MKKANLDIRQELKDANIPLWRLAMKQGCNEVTMVRRLRIELSENIKASIRSQVNEIINEDKEV